MTEPLLLQQLESPSGTGRDEPRSQISLPARTSNKRGCKPAPPFSLAVMRSAVQGRMAPPVAQCVNHRVTDTAQLIRVRRYPTTCLGVPASHTMTL